MRKVKTKNLIARKTLYSHQQKKIQLRMVRSHRICFHTSFFLPFTISSIDFKLAFTFFSNFINLLCLCIFAAEVFSQFRLNNTCSMNWNGHKSKYFWWEIRKSWLQTENNDGIEVVIWLETTGLFSNTLVMSMVWKGFLSN